jgi:hypothetical protein
MVKLFSQKMENRTKSLIAIIITLILVVLIFVWMVVLNTATITVIDKAPFVVRIGTNYKHCDASPCSLTIAAQKYNITVEKGGYFSYSAEVNLSRWQELTLEPKLRLIPHLGQEAESLTDSKIFSSDKTTPENLPTTNLLAYDQAPSDNLIYLVKDGDQQKLHLAIEGSEPTLITQFQLLKQPKIFASDSIVLITDEDKLYRVDMAEKRKEIILQQKVYDVRWSPSGKFAVIETQQNNLPLLSLYNASGKEIKPLYLQTAAARSAWTTDDRLIFISFQELNQQLETDFASIGLDAKELAGTKQNFLQDRLMEMNPITQELHILMVIPEEIGIEEVKLSDDEKILYAKISAGILRQIVLNE